MTPQWTNDRDALHREIAQLREKNEELACQVLHLSGMMRDTDIDFSHRWKLTGKEADLLRILIMGGIKTRATIMHLLYDGAEPKSDQVLDMFVMRLRQKMAEAGIEITCAWGRGFCLSNEHIKKIRDLCAQLEQAA